jgi:hypothetical protein
MQDGGQRQNAGISDGQPDWTMPYKEPQARELQGEVSGCFQMKMHAVLYRHAKECKELIRQ